MHLTLLAHAIARGILSVRPSYSVVLFRWMKIWSCGFQYQVGQSF